MTKTESDSWQNRIGQPPNGLYGSIRVIVIGKVQFLRAQRAPFRADPPGVSIGRNIKPGKVGSPSERGIGTFMDPAKEVWRDESEEAGN